MSSNIGYAIGTNKWFLGQIPPSKNEYCASRVDFKDAHGDRVKVRIPGMHPTGSPEDATVLSDDDLPWAIVAKPTTHGNRNAQSTGLWGGEWVIGFFLDPECQIPVITQVLTNNLNEYEIVQSTNGTTMGKSVSVYNCGRSPGGSTVGAPKPTESAKPTKEEFTKALS